MIKDAGIKISDKLKIFGSVALLFSLVYITLIIQNRAPFAHTTAQYSQLQYIYFNEVVQHHSIALWFPLETTGAIGNFYFPTQITLLAPVFYLLGLLFKGSNYLYLFYFALWFEEIFFLLGIILLSSIFYKHMRTILFVSITLLGTSIWYPEINTNFHIYYFIPMVLYCIHKYS